MSEIRPLRREEIPEVAALYRFVDRSDWRIPPAEVPDWFDRTLFAYPWVDPKIPSLVYVEDSGEILGFIGSHVRRLRFEGRPIRMAAAGPLIAHPRVRPKGVGALLWRRFLNGPQDLTITDGASDEMREIFELIGGHMLHPTCVAWACVFRPWSFLGDRLLHSRTFLREHVKLRVKPLWAALDRATTEPVSYFRPPEPPPSRGEPLTPDALLQNLAVMTRSLRLFPDYDAPFLNWLFAELHENRTWGTPVRRLIRDAHDRALGWYVYFLLPGGPCQVVHVAARDRHIGSVLDDLFAHAFSHGATAVQGRVEAALLAPLAHRGALFRYSPRSLVYTRHDELLAAIASGRALLTRLEGEWWMAT